MASVRVRRLSLTVSILYNVTPNAANSVSPGQKSLEIKHPARYA